MVDDSERHGSYAAQYDGLARAMEWHGHEALFGMVFEYVGPGQSLLDLGIGTGLGAFLFHKAGLKVYGADFSEDMLGVCEGKKIARELRVYDLSADNWPYRDGQFHHVASCGLFHFLGDLDAAFTEVRRILRAGGTFSFTVKDAPGGNTEYVDPESGIAVYCHGRAYIEDLARKYGFVPLKRMPVLAYDDLDKKESSVFIIYVLGKEPVS